MRESQWCHSGVTTPLNNSSSANNLSQRHPGMYRKWYTYMYQGYLLKHCDSNRLKPPKYPSTEEPVKYIMAYTFNKIPPLKK